MWRTFLQLVSKYSLIHTPARVLVLERKMVTTDHALNVWSASRIAEMPLAVLFSRSRPMVNIFFLAQRLSVPAGAIEWDLE
jgi:hypothetical protein